MEQIIVDINILKQLDLRRRLAEIDETLMTMHLSQQTLSLICTSISMQRNKVAANKPPNVATLQPRKRRVSFETHAQPPPVEIESSTARNDISNIIVSGESPAPSSQPSVFMGEAWKYDPMTSLEINIETLQVVHGAMQRAISTMVNILRNIVHQIDQMEMQRNKAREEIRARQAQAAAINAKISIKEDVALAVRNEKASLLNMIHTWEKGLENADAQVSELLGQIDELIFDISQFRAAVAAHVI